MIYLGIDNGKDGAVIVLDNSGKIISKHKTPLFKSATKGGKKLGKDEYDIVGMRDMIMGSLISEKDVMVTLEKAQPMPITMGGGVANYQRGLSFGLWQGLLVGLGVSYQIVTPQAWQKIMLAGINSEDTKQAGAIAAQRLWPKEDWRKSQLAKKADEGFVDAALIAEFGRRIHFGQRNQAI
jgi:hypothetical protein